MELSDNERRILEELEKQLATQDPCLARDLEAGKPTHRISLKKVFAAIAVAVGLTLVIVGIATQLVLLGVLGFALQCAGASWLSGERGWFRQTSGFPFPIRASEGEDPDGEDG